MKGKRRFMFRYSRPVHMAVCYMWQLMSLKDTTNLYIQYPDRGMHEKSFEALKADLKPA